MSGRRWLLRAFPRSWRARFGAQLGDLLDDMERASGRIGAADQLDIVRAGLTERLGVLGRHRRALLRSGLALFVAAAGAVERAGRCSMRQVRRLRRGTAITIGAAIAALLVGGVVGAVLVATSGPHRVVATASPATSYAPATTQPPTTAPQGSPSSSVPSTHQGGSTVSLSPPTSALPAPKVTLGKYLSPPQAVQRSAMGLSLLKGVEAKLVTFASVNVMLAKVGQGNFFRLNGSAWNPVVPSDPVYAVEASGTIPVSPGHIVHGWELQVLDPLTGRTFGGTGGRTSTLPELFAALPPFVAST